VAQLGSTGYNLYNQYQNQQYQNTLRSDAQNPAKVTALAQQYTQPLNAGLTAAVNNQTQAQLAQAGLSESPEIAQTVEAQAIAPYIQQNQQAGYADAIQALGLGGGAIPPAMQQQNGMASLAKAFSQLSGPGGSGSNPNQIQLLQNLYNLMQPNTPSIIPDPYAGIGPEPAPIDTSSWYTPDYSSLFSDAGASTDTGN
jgi:hypothetical protein